ncbi:MAG: Ca2+-dependent phosphoinositide-specific phospholipase C [Myxococcota bacterium]
MMLVLAVGCAAPDPGASPEPYPLDGVLRFDQLQAKGTHNSYHVQTSDLEPLAYGHAPLDVQLGEQGVRQFELDVYWDEAAGAHVVQHIPLLDVGTTCPTFVDCLAVLEGWSGAHPGHHPLLVLVETKDAWGETSGPAHLDALDAELLDVWPRERLITPDDLLAAGAPDLRTALADTGWPPLGALRGRARFVLHDGSARRDAYVADLAGRPMFPDAMGDVDVPWAAVHTMNDPWDPRITEVVGLGHLVRTRADAETVQAREEDPTMRDQALRSGRSS